MKKKISDLPDELLDSIFGKLPLSSQCESKAVCKRWRFRLSRCRARSKEGWILVNCLDHLLWYNVTRNRWVKKMSISSIPIPIKNPRLCCVYQELIFFRDESKPPLIACWNAATNETRVLRIEPVPGQCTPQFGAYTDESTGELTLFMLDFVGEDGRTPGYLYRCEVDRGGEWKIYSGPMKMRFDGPNFNNLTPNNRVVTFMDELWPLLHMYHVDRDLFETLGVFRKGNGNTDYFWNDAECGGRFHFPAHGTFVIGQPISGPFRVVTIKDLGLLKFDAKIQEFVLESRPPAGLVVEMHNEPLALYVEAARKALQAARDERKKLQASASSGDHQKNRYIYWVYRDGKLCEELGSEDEDESDDGEDDDEEELRTAAQSQGLFFFCSDGVENIWSLLPGCSRMLHYNVVSKDWTTLPSILPNREYDESDDDPLLRALYTSF